MDNFNYENIETKIQKGGKTIRKVSIKNGKGTKSIIRYHKGRKISTVRKPIHKDHIEMIKNHKFIKGLFIDCKHCNNKTRKTKNNI